MKTTEDNNEELNMPGIPQDELRGNLFRTPDGYFEGLNARVMNTVNGDQRSNAISKSPLQLIIRYAAPILAMILITVSIVHINHETNTSLDQQFNQLVNDIPIESIVFAEDITVAELVTNQLIDLESEAPDHDPSITDYLIENDVELSTIVHQITL